ncbi:GAF domain-containing protein, partial [candidate division KSB1 bacterium]|nr:GAF domain-containing protein [candidate division KSB1 bacterium]NIT69910.1 GAF domain-containing protein [candidate division KSB1 bacterium]NIX69591.1 GAF domain-containing protein [candidate division KSB1 bacterium]
MAYQYNHPIQDFDEDAALRSLLEGTAKETGEGFFFALVENLARAMHTSSAWVTEYVEETRKLRALAFWENGEWIKGVEYQIDGTPCEKVIDEACPVHVPEQVVTLYPEDKDLEKSKAVSYMGVPLQDIDGKVLGNLAIMDSRPMPEQPRAKALFQIFAARAAAEHQRLRAEKKVREREQKLSRLIN